MLSRTNAQTLCGTPIYMAPEVRDSHAHLWSHVDGCSEVEAPQGFQLFKCSLVKDLNLLHCNRQKVFVDCSTYTLAKVDRLWQNIFNHALKKVV